MARAVRLGPGRHLRRQPEVDAGRFDRQVAVRALELGLEEIHGRTADEAGHEHVGRVGVDLSRGVELLQHAVAQDGDTAAHGHGLDLVMSHVDDRRLEAAVKLDELGAGLDAQLGVEIRERLVHEEDLRLAYDGAAKRHALALAAG
jgi:hypothetical protein